MFGILVLLLTMTEELRCAFLIGKNSVQLRDEVITFKNVTKLPNYFEPVIKTRRLN